MTEKQNLPTVAAKLGIGSYHRHVFLCTGPNCCTPEEGLKAWEVLKKTLKDEGLTSGEHACYRTKVGCLRVAPRGRPGGLSRRHLVSRHDRGAHSRVRATASQGGASP